MTKKALNNAGRTILLLLGMAVVLYIAYLSIGLEWLAARHGEELTIALEQIETMLTRAQIEGETDALTNVIEQPLLDIYLESWSECEDCETQWVVIDVKVTDLELLSYWRGNAKARATTNIATAMVDRSNGTIEVPCLGTSRESIYILSRRSGVWRLKGGEFVGFDTATPVDGLRDRICPENWKELLLLKI